MEIIGGGREKGGELGVNGRGALSPVAAERAGTALRTAHFEPVGGHEHLLRRGVGARVRRLAMAHLEIGEVGKDVAFLLR